MHRRCAKDQFSRSTQARMFTHNECCEELAKVSKHVLWFLGFLCAGAIGAAEPLEQAPSLEQSPAGRAQKSADTKATWKVAYKDGRLDVVAQEAPLIRLMQEISRCTGVEILGLDRLESKISIQFSDLALEDGLRRLLAEVDHVFITDQRADDAALPHQLLVLRTGKKDVDRELATTQSEGDGVSSPTDEKRLETLENFARAGDLQGMREALLDPDPPVQTRALELLTEADPEEAATHVIEMTQSDKPEQRMRALDLLNESEVVDEQSVVSALGAALTDTALADTTADEDLKQFAIEALAERGGAEAMAYLKEALRDPDPKVRRLILESAAPYDEEHVLLREACFDEEATVRSLAIAWWPQCATGEDGG